MANTAYQNAVIEALKAKEGAKLPSLDQESLETEYFKTLPEGVTKETVEAVAKHDRDWGDSFHRYGSTSIAEQLRGRDDIDNLSVEFKTPLATYAVDYARVTAENPTKEDRVNSFSLRCSVASEENLLSDVRSRIGNLYEEAE